MNSTSEAQVTADDSSPAVNNARPDVVAQNRQPVYRAPDPRKKSPTLAGALSIVPGLGQVYVGYYKKGFTNILIVGCIISFLSVGDRMFQALLPLAGIFLFFFELYNIIDAYRRALLYNLTLDGIEQMELPDEMSEPAISVVKSGSVFGGIVFLIFGVIALSNTAFDYSLDWLADWWPIAPIAFGGYLIYRGYLDSKTKVSNSE